MFYPLLTSSFSQLFRFPFFNNNYTSNWRSCQTLNVNILTQKPTHTYFRIILYISVYKLPYLCIWLHKHLFIVDWIFWNFANTLSRTHTHTLMHAMTNRKYKTYVCGKAIDVLWSEQIQLGDNMDNQFSYHCIRMFEKFSDYRKSSNFNK